jgi:hypothetical protein
MKQKNDKIRALLIFVLGVCFGAMSVYFFPVRHLRQQLADDTILNVANGLEFGKWAHNGENKRAAEGAEIMMLGAMRRVAKQYGDHPGVGYWFSKLNTYYETYNIQLSKADRETLGRLKAMPVREEEQFYYYH